MRLPVLIVISKSKGNVKAASKATDGDARMTRVASKLLPIALSLLLSACPGGSDDNDDPGTTSLICNASNSDASLNWFQASESSSYKSHRDNSVTIHTESQLPTEAYHYQATAINSAVESNGADISLVAQNSSSGGDDDPLQQYQWHLENTGQSAFASNVGTSGEDINHSAALALGVTGDGIRVNVIDTGLELQHPDLQANIVAGGSYDYVNGDNDPTNNYQSNGDHGTSVAGLIAAVGDNSIGVSGVAGDALLQGYNYLLSDPQTTDGYIFAHGQAANLEDTDIFNKSLGVDGISYDWRLNDDTLDTLSCLTSNGSFDNSSTCTGALRSGLGAIYVKSAGNNFEPEDEDNYVCDDFDITCVNANMEPEHTYPYQIVVGALNAKGKKSSYSTAGSAIWISAPGGEYGWEQDHIDEQLASRGLSHENYVIPDSRWEPAMITTDQVSCNRGYTTRTVSFSGIAASVTSFHSNSSLNSNCEYTSTFNGTSSAAPVVSGVVALMLEANSGLSWRDVKHILANSARQVDSNAASLNITRTDCSGSSCTFTVRDAWITNAAGYKYHNWYGFGAVNAGAAVTMAKDYSSTLGTWKQSSYGKFVSASIPDSTGSAATTNMTVSDNLTIEAVQLDLSITHTAIGDLAVVLYSPSGTRSVLLTPYNQYGADDDFSSTLLSNAFYGEKSSGDWNLEVYDLWQGDCGTLESATLNIYGH